MEIPSNHCTTHGASMSLYPSEEVSLPLIPLSAHCLSSSCAIIKERPEMGDIIQEGDLATWGCLAWTFLTVGKMAESKHLGWPCCVTTPPGNY